MTGTDVNRCMIFSIGSACHFQAMLVRALFFSPLPLSGALPPEPFPTFCTAILKRISAGAAVPAWHPPALI